MRVKLIAEDDQNPLKHLIWHTEQVESLKELVVGAYKAADHMSKANKRARGIFESTIAHDNECYTVGMYWSDEQRRFARQLLYLTCST